MEWTKEDCIGLSIKNPHPLDSHVKFHEPTHAYAILCPIRGWVTKPNVISVTGIIDTVKPEFDKFGNSMATASRLANAARAFASQKFESTDDFESGKTAAFGWYASLYNPGMTVGAWQTAILDLWEFNGKTEARNGTEFHRDIERYWDGLPPLLPPSPEWDQFLAWISANPDIIPYRTEWRLSDPEHDLAGSSDFFYSLPIDPERTKRVIDWKRYKDVYNRGASAKQKAERARGPLAHLGIPWTTIFSCTLQTWTYARMVEETRGFTILSCAILSCHPMQTRYELIDLPKPDASIIDLCLAPRRTLVAARRAAWIKANSPLLPKEPARKLTAEEMRERRRRAMGEEFLG